MGTIGVSASVDIRAGEPAAGTTAKVKNLVALFTGREARKADVAKYDGAPRQISAVMQEKMKTFGGLASQEDKRHAAPLSVSVARVRQHSQRSEERQLTATEVTAPPKEASSSMGVWDNRPINYVARDMRVWRLVTLPDATSYSGTALPRASGATLPLPIRSPEPELGHQRPTVQRPPLEYGLLFDATRSRISLLDSQIKAILNSSTMTSTFLEIKYRQIVHDLDKLVELETDLKVYFEKYSSSGRKGNFKKKLECLWLGREIVKNFDAGYEWLIKIDLALSGRVPNL